MVAFRENDILILFGAGVSVDAGIPHSNQMIRELERKLEKKPKLRQLYDYVKSSIYFSNGTKGRFGEDVNYNIETLVNSLEELARRDEHPLFPFVGAWHPVLSQLAGPGFENVQKLRALILELLRKKWVSNPNYEEVEYFENLVDLQQSYGYPLKVFTLNYDLCVERAWKKRTGNYPERGFEERVWTWTNYDRVEDSAQSMYLYKLHGSTDWKREDGDLRYLDDPTRIEDSDAEIIFGSAYKLQYVDPFLFFAYEFRRWTLEAKLIVCVGYGFGDEHINGILGQALRKTDRRVLVAIGPVTDDEDERKRISSELGSELDGQIEIENAGAKEFFEKKLTLEFFGSKLPQDDDPF